MVSGTEQRRFARVVAVVLILDLATKLAAEVWLRRYIGVPVIGEFFQLRLVYNPGAAFGINVGPWSRWVFMGLSTAALVVLGSMLRATRAGDSIRLYSLALISAGAAGNLVDRIRSPQGVVDFLDFTFGTWHFPTFNVADSAVTCGAVLLALSLWNEGQHHEHAVVPAVPGAAPVASEATPPPAGLP
jgi:signal peptidase II